MKQQGAKTNLYVNVQPERYAAEERIRCIHVCS